MLGLLGGLPWRLIGIAALVLSVAAGAVFAVKTYRSAIHDQAVAENRAALAEQAAAESARAARDIAEARADADEAAARYRSEARRLAASLAQARRSLTGARTDPDCADLLARRLCGAVDSGLRRLETAARAGGVGADMPTDARDANATRAQ